MAGGTVGASVAGSTPSTGAAPADASSETRCLVTTLPLRPLPPRVPQPPPERGAGSVDARARTPGRGSGRPLLPAALRPVWRSDQALQLGLDPDRAVVVDGIDEPIAKTLLGLDGTRTEAEVLAGAAETGLDPDLVGDLLTDLRTAGILAEVTPRPPSAPAADSPAGSAPARPALLGAEPTRHAPADPAPAGPDPAGDSPPGEGPLVMASWPRRSPYGAVGAAGRLGPDLASLSLVPTTHTPFEVVRARRAASVVVHGAGRVGASLATLLAAAGVGQVHVADRGPVRPGDVAPAGVAAADVDRSRTGAAAEALRRAAPEIRSTPPTPGRRPDLVVLASTEPVDTTLRTALAGGQVAHLVAGVRETTAVVGPLVLPGRTGCLRCGDLHRADRDPAWPVVAAQLVGIRRRREEPCDVVLATVAASLAALHCLAHLDGRPSAATGASLELSLTDWRLRRRSWPAHPRCDCGAAA
jgi:ThiF family protein